MHQHTKHQTTPSTRATAARGSVAALWLAMTVCVALALGSCEKDQPATYPLVLLNTGAPADALRMYRKTADGKFQQFPTDKQSQEDFTQIHTEELVPIFTSVRQITLLSDKALEMVYQDPNEAAGAPPKTLAFAYSIQDGLVLIENDTVSETPLLLYNQTDKTMTAIARVSYYNYYNTILKARANSPLDLNFSDIQTDNYDTHLAEISTEYPEIKTGDTLSLSLVRIQYK